MEFTIRINFCLPKLSLKLLRRTIQAGLLILLISFFRLLFKDYTVDLQNDQFLGYHQSASSETYLKNDFQNALEKPKVILYWTQFFDSEDYRIGLGEEPFIKAKCNINAFRCIATRDRSLINESDAIIFHPRNLSVDDLPPPKWRQPQQKYIFYNLESPAYVNMTLLDYFKDFFNWTMTYRRDSDILHTQYYGQLNCIDSDKSTCQCLPLGVRCSPSSKNETRPLHFNNRNYWKKKKRPVAWIVSHCKTDSNREDLVERLREYINVDIFGKCPRAYDCGGDKRCNKLLQKHYRFYLSFENSICPDYVTEKLYKPLAFDTVPVVLGGADYSQYLPAGSYVNAREFHTAHALAEHLKKIMEDEETYASYFNWKSKYMVDLDSLQGWCHLCEQLHNKSVEEKVYSDISKWWYKTTNNQTCTSLPYGSELVIE